MVSQMKYLNHSEIEKLTKELTDRRDKNEDCTEIIQNIIAVQSSPINL